MNTPKCPNAPVKNSSYSTPETPIQARRRQAAAQVVPSVDWGLEEFEREADIHYKMIELQRVDMQRAIRLWMRAFSEKDVDDRELMLEDMRRSANQ